jgi:excisionase family DNA binding protein
MSVGSSGRDVASRVEKLPTLLDVLEVAEVLRTTPRHVRRLVEERRIPFVKVGRFVRFDSDEIGIWLSSHRVAVTDRSKRTGW